MKKPRSGRTQLSKGSLSRSLKMKTKNSARRGDMSASRAAKQPTGGRAYDLRQGYGRPHDRLLGPQGDLHQLHAQALARAIAHAGARGPVDRDHAGERGGGG